MGDAKTQKMDQPKQAILKEFPKGTQKKKTYLLMLGSIAVVLGGIITGYFLSGGKANNTKVAGPEETTEIIRNDGMEAGVKDTSTFPDEAEGILVKGGIEGEGTHHLDRGLGPEKMVYLTSTVIDLESFVDKKVKVWGETISGKHAGWLMDVGKIKTID